MLLLFIFSRVKIFFSPGVPTTHDMEIENKSSSRDDL